MKRGLFLLFLIVVPAVAYFFNATSQGPVRRTEVGQTKVATSSAPAPPANLAQELADLRKKNSEFSARLGQRIDELGSAIEAACRVKFEPLKRPLPASLRPVKVRKQASMPAQSISSAATPSIAATAAEAPPLGRMAQWPPVSILVTSLVTSPSRGGPIPGVVILFTHWDRCSVVGPRPDGRPIYGQCRPVGQGQQVTGPNGIASLAIPFTRAGVECVSAQVMGEAAGRAQPSMMVACGEALFQPQGARGKIVLLE